MKITKNDTQTEPTTRRKARMNNVPKDKVLSYFTLHSAIWRTVGPKNSSRTKRKITRSSNLLIRYVQNIFFSLFIGEGVGVRGGVWVEKWICRDARRLRRYLPFSQHHRCRCNSTLLKAEANTFFQLPATTILAHRSRLRSTPPQPEFTIISAFSKFF